MPLQEIPEHHPHRAVRACAIVVLFSSLPSEKSPGPVLAAGCRSVNFDSFERALRNTFDLDFEVEAAKMIVFSISHDILLTKPL